MDRKKIEALRQNVRRWADVFEPQCGDQRKGEMPATPSEAYARASWCSETRIEEICDVLLAGEEHVGHIRPEIVVSRETRDVLVRSHDMPMRQDRRCAALDAAAQIWAGPHFFTDDDLAAHVLNSAKRFEQYLEHGT